MIDNENNLKSESRTIPIIDISPNDYNSQEMAKDKYRGLVSHIREVGFTDPIKVRKVRHDFGDPETLQTEWVIIDGEHRLRAYIEVYSDAMDIECKILKEKDGGDFTRAKALISTIAYNFQHGEDNPMKMSMILKEAVEKHRTTIDDIEEITGIKRNRIENFISFEDIPESHLGSGGFDGNDNGGGLPKARDMVIVSFAIDPDDRVKIEKAVNIISSRLGPEIDELEVRGICLIMMAEGIISNENVVANAIPEQE